MNVPLTVKVPFELAAKLHATLDQVSKLHSKLGRKLRVAGASEATTQRPTLHSLVRACILAGAGVLDKKPGDLLKLISQDTVKVGRPSRGSRAA